MHKFTTLFTFKQRKTTKVVYTQHKNVFFHLKLTIAFFTFAAPRLIIQKYQYRGKGLVNGNQERMRSLKGFNRSKMVNLKVRKLRAEIFCMDGR